MKVIDGSLLLNWTGTIVHTGIYYLNDTEYLILKKGDIPIFTIENKKTVCRVNSVIISIIKNSDI